VNRGERRRKASPHENRTALATLPPPHCGDSAILWGDCDFPRRLALVTRWGADASVKHSGDGAHLALPICAPFLRLCISSTEAIHQLEPRSIH
jgi:hypothetical protein